MPHNDDGTRIEPFVSEPSASGTRPPPTAAPEPPDDPPVMRSEVMRIARRAVVNILAGEVVGVFAHIERAEEDGAGGFEPLDQRRVAMRRRIVAIDFRAGDGGNARDIDEVLDRERHARKRAYRFAPRARGVDRLRPQQRALLGDRSERIQQRVALANAGKGRFDDADGARLAGRHRAAIAAAVGGPKSVAGVSSIEHRSRFGVVRQREFVDQSRRDAGSVAD